MSDGDLRDAVTNAAQSGTFSGLDKVGQPTVIGAVAARPIAGFIEENGAPPTEPGGGFADRAGFHPVDSSCFLVGPLPRFP